MKRAMREGLAIFLLLGLGGSCGDLDSAEAPLEVSTCQDNWSVLLQASGNVWDIGTSTNGFGLSWSNGQLYFRYWDKAAAAPWAIASISTADSSRSYSNVASVYPPYWWIEDDQLIYVDGGYQLYGVPLAGGVDPMQLLDMVQDTTDPLFFNFVLDADAVYWVSLERATTSWSVWRALRASGERQQLMGMPVSNAASGESSTLTLTQDSVMVSDGVSATLGGKLYLVPKTGGDARVLPAPSSAWLLATSPDGTTLWLESLSGGKSYRLWRSTIDGAAPAQFWTDKPPALFLTHAWSDGNGGWYLAAREYTSATMDVDSEHTSIWSLDSSGHGARLACSPLPGTTFELATALSPTTLFLLDRDGSSSATKSILSIAR
jgi:hypothetical protein